MTLIKDMLDNLERRNESSKKENINKNLDKNRLAASKVVIPKKSVKNKRMSLAFGIVTLVFVIGVATYFVMLPETYQVAKNKVSLTINKIVTAVKPNTASQQSQGQLAKSTNEHKVSPPKSSNTVHAMYLTAIKNLNEGNIDKAIRELKVIIDEDPTFEPAKQTYKSINSQYGVNATK